ncbi:MAG: hypothetical protein HY902_06330 [Deltaproteobacteria bacterium]|nr:hypothetical protein [Deltaproteobacteria bacterium]
MTAFRPSGCGWLLADGGLHCGLARAAADNIWTGKPDPALASTGPAAMADSAPTDQVIDASATTAAVVLEVFWLARGAAAPVAHAPLAARTRLGDIQNSATGTQIFQ